MARPTPSRRRPAAAWASVAALLTILASARIGVPRAVWAPVQLVGWNTPGLGWATALLPAGRAVRRTVAPTPASPALSGALYVPAGPGAHPPVLFVNGVDEGWRDPQVEAVSRSLAALGYTVYVPNLPALGDNLVEQATVSALAEDIAWFHASPYAGGRPVALFGVCAGASLAILADEYPDLGADIRAVVAVDPYARLSDLLEAATVGRAPDARGRLGPFAMDPWVAWVIAASAVATVPPGPGQTDLAAALGPDTAAQPLQSFRTSVPPAGAGAAADAWWRLLGNTAPSAFQALYAALPAGARGELESLSPAAGAARLASPILIAAPVTDFAFPSGEASELAAANPREVRLTRTAALDHVQPSLTPLDAVGYIRLWWYSARALAAMG